MVGLTMDGMRDTHEQGLTSTAHYLWPLVIEKRSTPEAHYLLPI